MGPLVHLTVTYMVIISFLEIRSFKNTYLQIEMSQLLTCNNITTTIMFKGTLKKFIMVDLTVEKNKKW